MKGRFRRLRKIDFIAVLMLAGILAILTSYIERSDSRIAFMASFFFTSAFAAFTSLLIRRAGAALLFYLAWGIMTINSGNLGSSGLYRMVILIVSGIVFELTFAILEMEIRNIPLGIIIGAALSNFSMPFSMLLLIKSTNGLMPFVLNFAVTSLIIGVMGSVSSFLVWYNLKGLKPIIKFEYSS